MLAVAINTQQASAVLVWQGHCPGLCRTQRPFSLIVLSLGTLTRDSRAPCDVTLLDSTKQDQRTSCLHSCLKPRPLARGPAYWSGGPRAQTSISYKWQQIRKQNQCTRHHCGSSKRRKSFDGQGEALDSNLYCGQIPG